MSDTEFIYIDFETNTAGEFYLAGDIRNGQFRTVVLNENLFGLAKHHNFLLTTPAEYVQALLEQKAKKFTVLVSYRNYEQELVNQLCSKKTIPAHDSYYHLDLWRAAKNWARKKHPGKLKDLGRVHSDKFRSSLYSLVSVMRLTDFNPPGDYHIGQTTQRANSVIRGLVAKCLTSAPLGQI
jgi:hypothetical protein